MDATHVHESYVNATEGYRFGDNTYEVEGTVFEDMTPGEAYRWLVKEYGRCTGKVYRDTESAPLHCGWVFIKRDKYEDTGEPYTREVWVTFSRETEPAMPATHEPVSLSA